MIVSRRWAALLALALVLTACLLCAGCTKKEEPQPDLPPIVQPQLQPQPQPEPEPVYETQPDASPVYETQPDTQPVYDTQPDAEPVYETQPDAEPEIAYPNPLTGEDMGTGYYLNARPAAVMLNDIKAALPQYGTSQADMIIEIVAEGGITRMIGLYQDVTDIPQIGSIRSTRPYYLDVVQGFDAILIHCGGSTEAYSLMRSRGMDHIDGIYTSAIFWRDQDRANSVGSEHSMFTSGPLIQDYLAGSDYRLTHDSGWQLPLTFADDGTPADGSEALTVHVPISGYKSTDFSYDEALGRYLVSQFDAPYADGQDGSQVAVTNVLVLYANVYATGDSYGHMAAVTTGSGEGLFCCGGKAQDITWSRSAVTDPFQFAAADGSPLTLGRGTTYVCIVSNSCDVTAGGRDAQ